MAKQPIQKKDKDFSSDTRFIANLLRAINSLRLEMLSNYKRHVSVGDLFFDRWDTAKFYGFGEGTSCYNNVLILGNVKVGKNTWIGPNVVLDGSGDLSIGDYVSVSAGVQIYTHNSVDWSTSLGKSDLKKKPTKIGSGVYIGPNAVIEMGVNVGDGAIIGAMSFVNKDIPAGGKYVGIPAVPVPVPAPVPVPVPVPVRQNNVGDDHGI